LLLQKAKTEMEETDVNAAHKEKSVLQAKLTKLAIQIGYVGMCHLIQQAGHTEQQRLH